MNSLRRPHNVRLHDLRNFLHVYESLGKTAGEWATQASVGLQHGSLIFILEPIATLFGLGSFGKKEDDENFRVTELAIVVRQEDRKTLVLNASPIHYELRFLAPLLEEKIRKAANGS